MRTASSCSTLSLSRSLCPQTISNVAGEHDNEDEEEEEAGEEEEDSIYSGEWKKKKRMMRKE